MKRKKTSKRKKEEQARVLSSIQALWESENSKNWPIALVQAESFGISAKKLCRLNVIYHWFKNDGSKINRRGHFLGSLLATALSNEALLDKGRVKPFALRVGEYMERVIVGLGFKLMKEKGDKAIADHWDMWSVRCLPLSGHQIHKVKKQIGIKKFNFIP